MLRTLFRISQNPLRASLIRAMSTEATTRDVATFGAGCYWGTEKFFRVDFQKLKPDSIIDVQVGFMGGDVVNPTYRQVCEGDTNHVEVAQITYDTSKATYEDLVKFFFSMHDASTINRQGNDAGVQYASVIYTHSADQEKIAKQVKARLQKIFEDTLAAGSDAVSQNEWKSSEGDTLQWKRRTRYEYYEVNTRIEPASEFYSAHEDHQRYLEKNPGGYCNHSIRFTW